MGVKIPIHGPCVSRRSAELQLCAVSRSETTTVAVGLSPRTAAHHTIGRRGATTERSKKTVGFNRRSATRDCNTPAPWTEVHGTVMASLCEAAQRSCALRAQRHRAELELCAPMRDASAVSRLSELSGWRTDSRWQMLDAQ